MPRAEAHTYVRPRGNSVVLVAAEVVLSVRFDEKV